LTKQDKEYHLRRSDESLLQHQEWLRSKVRRFPDHQIRHLTHLHTSHHVADTLRQRRINCIFTDIPLDAMVIRSSIIILRERASLLLILMRRIPSTEDNLTAAAHCLRIRRHHTDSTCVVEHVFSLDGFSADTAVCEGDVFRDVLGQVMAGHDHVEVFVDRVASVWLGWIGGARKDIGMLNKSNHIWGMASTGTFNVIGVDCAAFECRCSAFDKTGFVQGVGVNLALNVVFFADAVLPC